jgi:hypothetical protein
MVISEWKFASAKRFTLVISSRKRFLPKTFEEQCSIKDMAQLHAYDISTLYKTRETNKNRANKRNGIKNTRPLT